MNIAIIGTGNVGGALASRWSEAGHQIFLGLQDPTKLKQPSLLNLANTQAYSIAEAVQKAEVILVATPPEAALSLLSAFGDIQGKVLIDASNSVRSKPENYPTAFHAFEDLSSAEVVKCFNSTGFENMKNPLYGEVKLDMFMAGNSDRAKSVAEKLALEAGFEKVYDFGKSDKVVLLEQFALAWINLAIMQGLGREIAFKVIHRPE